MTSTSKTEAAGFSKLSSVCLPPRQDAVAHRKTEHNRIETNVIFVYQSELMAFCILIINQLAVRHHTAGDSNVIIHSHGNS
jgi:hypothetical protein